LFLLFVREVSSVPFPANSILSPLSRVSRTPRIPHPLPPGGASLAIAKWSFTLARPVSPLVLRHLLRYSFPLPLMCGASPALLFLLFLSTESLSNRNVCFSDQGAFLPRTLTALPVGLPDSSFPSLASWRRERCRGLFPWSPPPLLFFVFFYTPPFPFARFLPGRKISLSFGRDREPYWRPIFSVYLFSPLMVKLRVGIVLFSRRRR